MSRLRRVARSLHRVRETAFAASGLRAWEFDILSLLRRAPGGELTPSQLATATGSATGTITYRADRLAERGYVAREENPLDHRSRIITLRPEGRELVEAAMRTLVAAESELLQGLDRREVAAFIQTLRTIGSAAH
jgi:DNA-binding MarR family transcriptional regulator